MSIDAKELTAKLVSGEALELVDIREERIEEMHLGNVADVATDLTEQGRSSLPGLIEGHAHLFLHPYDEHILVVRPVEDADIPLCRTAPMDPPQVVMGEFD